MIPVGVANRKEASTMPHNVVNDLVRLPEPRHDGPISVEAALAAWRSVREFSAKPINIDTLAQLLWACQGPVGNGRHRTAPSAGGTYPLEILVAAGNVDGLESGLYRYDGASHVLHRTAIGDFRRELYAATVGQTSGAVAPVSLLFVADYDRSTARYGTRGMAYTLIETGHVGQNLYLQATALGLGTTAIGAFREDVVRTVLNLEPQEHPVYLFPVGTPAD